MYRWLSFFAVSLFTFFTTSHSFFCFSTKYLPPYRNQPGPMASECELSISTRVCVCVCVCHLSGSVVVVSSCLDKDLRLRLISMPSLGSRPLFLFSCSLSLGLYGGGGGAAGQGSRCKCVSERKRARVCVCVCVLLYVEGLVREKCPPGVCFGPVMRSWLVVRWDSNVCERWNLLVCSLTENTHLLSELADKCQNSVTRGRTVFSQTSAAIVRQSLALV